MRSTFLLLLTSLLTFCSAFAQESRPSHLYARSNLTDCQDILDSNALNQTCYDVLGIDAYIKSWNLTTTTCLRGELWVGLSLAVVVCFLIFQ